MGGVDKGLQMFQGRPLVDQVLARLAPQVGGIIISANRNTDAYARYGWPVLADELPDAEPGFLGPLAGILTGLRHVTTPWIVTSPCDAPFLPLNLVSRLAAAATNADMAVVWQQGRPEPVFMLCRTTLADHLAAYLASGQRRLFGWQQSLAPVRVDFDDCPKAFANFNTLADLGGA